MDYEEGELNEYGRNDRGNDRPTKPRVCLVHRRMINRNPNSQELAFLNGRMRLEYSHS